MSLLHSEPSACEGQFDGAAVDFTYAGGRGELGLRYRANGSTEAIDGQSIIACIADGDEHALLYVDAPTDAQALPAFKSARARNLPPAFVADNLLRQKPVATPDAGIHVVVSTKSGTCLAEQFYNDALVPLLRALGLQEDLDYAVHRTRSANTVTELTRDIFLPAANDGVTQRIIVLAGDGGILDITNGLLAGARSERFVPPAVALLPVGTGNALAHSSGVTDDNTWGLATLARGETAALPLLRATFSPGARLLVDEGSREEELPLRDLDGRPIVYGAVVCSWGMHAGLVADSDTAEYRKYGVERFQMAAKEALYPADGGEPHHYRGKVSLLKVSEGLDSWTPLERREHAYVLATLVSRLEKTFMISPSSAPLGGELRLVHFGPMAGDEVMRVMGLAYQGGKHVDEPAVGYEAVDGVRIDFEGAEEEARWRRICVDGKIVRVEKSGWVEMRRERAQVVELVRDT
ncbi:uncharacterized protein K452DRAFT_284513 [Aplosporella prunicola CBS 121167]|uniref:DAGKc domain-containing protein n=1 Tax=Aplosporella prunicola CBS 121167 TaxID=1176127 RepID=A0A6A6BNW0_9PEZI|nr:uncharacterized protein K452DRAFT_284513 [Aplosporella prunicola CBS 121167]KAF2145123.1 hypothetical protein K452DRAFT_284513 [Aplosporella prunicola CBS 121167]